MRRTSFLFTCHAIQTAFVLPSFGKVHNICGLNMIPCLLSIVIASIIQ